MTVLERQKNETADENGANKVAEVEDIRGARKRKLTMEQDFGILGGDQDALKPPNLENVCQKTKAKNQTSNSAKILGVKLGGKTFRGQKLRNESGC